MRTENDFDAWLQRLQTATAENFLGIRQEILIWIEHARPEELEKLRSWIQNTLRNIRGGQVNANTLEPFSTGLTMRQDPAAAPILGELVLLMEGSEVEDVAEALGDMGPAAAGAVPFLMQLVRRAGEDTAWTRAKAASSLGQIGDRSAIPVLTDALSDPRSSVRLMTVEALGKLRGVEAIPRIQHVAEHDADPQVREEAKRVVTDLVENLDTPPRTNAPGGS